MQVVHIAHLKVEDELVVRFAGQAAVVRGNSVHSQDLVSGIPQWLGPLHGDRVEQLSGDKRRCECVCVCVCVCVHPNTCGSRFTKNLWQKASSQ